MLAAALPVAWAAEPIQRVDVRVVVAGGDPAAAVTRRLQEVAATAAERLLLGRDSAVVTQQQAMLAGVLREVIDRVVAGYRARAVSLQPGGTTAVLVGLEPQPPILGALPVQVAYADVHADVQPLVHRTLASALPEASALTVRLPAAALEWAGPLLQQEVAALVERAVAGFTGTGRVDGTPPRLVLTVRVRDARVVRDIGVRFRSSSIPYWLLNQHTPQVLSMAEPLRGLPVTFASAHRTELERLLAGRLAAYPPAVEYGVAARPQVQVAEVTYVTVVADSTLYRGRVEARLNLGTHAPVPDVRAQLGRALGGLEPFVELTLIPSNLAWRWAVGVRVELGSSVAVGVRTRLDGEDSETFLQYRLSPDLQLRAGHFARAGQVETALSYRLNEFVSWEAVVTSRGDMWLRLVTNL
ncbi:MAG: hypothetical protein QN183_04635 [Armatimonadota bacterium]|nr:hypothetical protein [Armatimonadota bacterium]MDR7532415.1 hypothetical protein [Armatimonadota bacterium]MDR7535638.1 hypothetical protein [Armatimonadota bacterium]